jgi:hypothetical protein
MAWFYLFLAGDRLGNRIPSFLIGRLGTSVVFAAARPTVRRTLNRAGLKPPLVRYSVTAREAATMAPQ